MNTYSKSSEKNLNTAHPDLQVLFHEVLKYFDHAITYGHRSSQLQFALYKKGRVWNGVSWIVKDRSKIVTNCDGITKKSKHNSLPSEAVDAVPYPIDWGDTERLSHFAGFVKGTAISLFVQGKMTHRIRWGGDWDDDTEIKDEIFRDGYHFEIIP